MSKVKLFKTIEAFLKGKWYSKSGLYLALIFLTLLFLPIMIVKNQNITTSILFVCIIDVFVFALWMFSRKLPKTTKGKVGFIVGIYSTNDDEGKRLKEDFLIPLRQLMRQGVTGNTIEFVELPQHISEEIIDIDKAQEIRLKTKAHFMLYGRVRLRKLNGEEIHIIDLNGVVSHRPLKEKAQKTLEKEFVELLPSQVRFSTENDLLYFQLTSETTEVVARYIMGIASAYSGNLDYSEQLYLDSLNKVRSNQENHPIYKKLANRIPVRLAEIYDAKAHRLYQKWLISRDQDYISEIGILLEKIDDDLLKDPQLLNFRAIHSFLADRDLDKAFAFLKKIKVDTNGIKEFSLAFLNAYKGDLKLAIREYRKASKYYPGPNVLNQIESFICWILEVEPDKIQFHYCLGFFNWKVKGDLVRAKKDFENFLKECGDSQFNNECKMTNKWLEIINKGF